MSSISQSTDLSSLKQAMLDLPPFKFSQVRKSFEIDMNRVNMIEKLQSVEKYRVVFIGEPGKGKTTAICNWLNLLREDKSKVGTKEKIFLLTAATGRTTVSEVHIKQTDAVSAIRVSYLPIQVQVNYVREFCNAYWVKFNKTVDEDSEVDLSQELYRLIRNMAGLEDPSSGTTDKSIEKNKQLREFIEKFDDVDEFYDYVLNKIDLPSRRQEYFPHDNNSTLESWLSEQFHNINFGLHPSCSIMDKVYIEISKEDLDMHLPDYVAEIIDTIGLDSEVREDLQNLMLADDTVCFLMDDLTNVPSVLVRNLINKTFSGDAVRYKNNKVSIFVKSPILDLMNVNEANGDIQRGKEIKLGELKAVCLKNNVPYEVENTLFADSCAAYNVVVEEVDKVGSDGKHKIVTESHVNFNDNAAQIYRTKVNNCIGNLIERFKNYLSNQVGVIRSEVDNLIRLDEELERTAKIEFAHLHEVLQQATDEFHNSSPHWGLAEELTEQTVGRLHWARVKKLNRIYGGPYKSWKDDIYTSIHDCGRQLFLKYMRLHKEELNHILIDVRNEMVRNMTETHFKQIDDWEDEAANRVASEFYDWAMEEGFYPLDDTNPFWVTVQGIHGTGYTRNVREQYSNKFRWYDGKLNDIIRSEIEQIYKNECEMFEDDERQGVES